MAFMGSVARFWYESVFDTPRHDNILDWLNETN